MKKLVVLMMVVVLLDIFVPGVSAQGPWERVWTIGEQLVVTFRGLTAHSVTTYAEVTISPNTVLTVKSVGSATVQLETEQGLQIYLRKDADVSTLLRPAASDIPSSTGITLGLIPAVIFNPYYNGIYGWGWYGGGRQRPKLTDSGGPQGRHHFVMMPSLKKASYLCLPPFFCFSKHHAFLFLITFLAHDFLLFILLAS